MFCPLYDFSQLAWIYFIPPCEEFYKLFIIFVFQKRVYKSQIFPRSMWPLLVFPEGFFYSLPSNLRLSWDSSCSHNWKLMMRSSLKRNHSLSPCSVQAVYNADFISGTGEVINSHKALTLASDKWCSLAGTQICGHHSH